MAAQIARTLSLLALLALAGACAGRQPQARSLPDSAAPLEAPRPAVQAPSGSLPSDPAQRAQRLLELRQARGDVHLGRKIAFAGISLGVAGFGLSLLSEALIMHLERCDTASDRRSTSFNHCYDHDVIVPVALVGAGLEVAGGVMLAVSLRRLFPALRQHKQINREMRALHTMQLSMGARAAPLGLTVRGSF
ncbi:MAG: hypothetical protein JWN48_3500 [Myxococcaceae bacterium]|nr:hypothetical protein [Myxococcaceae bacterium]